VDTEMRVADGFGGPGMVDQGRPIDDLADPRDQLERSWHGETVADTRYAARVSNNS